MGLVAFVVGEEASRDVGRKGSHTGITPEGADRDFFSIKALGESDGGWSLLLKSQPLQESLRQRLRASDKEKLADALDFAAMAEKDSRFIFHDRYLVHNDIRADNCAWHADRNEIRLVDWNWTQLGDRRIDLSAMLVDVHRSGFDVLVDHSARLDRDALHWLAGFWFKSAAAPIWPKGLGHLRRLLRLSSGITALELAEQV